MLLGNTWPGLPVTAFEFGGPRPELTLNGDNIYSASTTAALEEPFLFPICLLTANQMLPNQDFQ